MQRERSPADRLDDYDRRSSRDDYPEERGRAKQFRNDTGEKVAADTLRDLVDRIERLEDDRADIGTDIKEIYAEAKGNGFDVTMLRKLIGLRKKPADERMKAQKILDMYISAMGMPD